MYTHKLRAPPSIGEPGGRRCCARSRRPARARPRHPTRSRAARLRICYTCRMYLVLVRFHIITYTACLSVQTWRLEPGELAKCLLWRRWRTPCAGAVVSARPRARPWSLGNASHSNHGLDAVPSQASWHEATQQMACRMRCHKSALAHWSTADST